jgi:hypothetical protein
MNLDIARLTSELVEREVFAQLPNVSPEVVLMIEMIEANGSDPVVSNGLERYPLRTASVRKMVAEPVVEGFRLFIAVGADEPVIDLPDGERPVGPIFVEDVDRGIEQLDRLPARIIVVDVSPSDFRA